MDPWDKARLGWRIEDVLARTDLADLLDQVAQPAMFATRGRRWHCPVPDHDDHHASVTIHTDHCGHQRWRCWSGDSSHRGDAVDLVRVTQRVGRSEAVDWLAARAGMTPDVPLPPIAPRSAPVKAPVDQPLDPCVLRYVDACEKILWRPTGRPVLEWLHGRGFDDDLLRANRVGCDPGRQMMHRQRGLPYGGSVGAVFPAFNEYGEVHYVQTRYLNPGTGPKYDNPSAALAANPRVAFVQPAQHVDRTVAAICEGIPDALTGNALGYRSVAVLGAAAPDASVVNRISRWASGSHLLVVQDNDSAGRAFATTIADLLPSGVSASTLRLDGTDLNGWWQQALRDEPHEFDRRSFNLIPGERSTPGVDATDSCSL